MTIRDKLIAARYRKGLSQQEAAGLLQVTRATLSQWERGITTPYAFHVKRLCTFYEANNPADLDLEPIAPSITGQQDGVAQKIVHQQEHQDKEPTQPGQEAHLLHTAGNNGSHPLSETEAQNTF